MILLLTLACTGKGPDDTGDGNNNIPLAHPTVAIVAPMTYGQLRSTCLLTLDIYPDGDLTTPLTSLSYNARGGDWLGTGVDGDVEYQAIGGFDDCINTGDPSGTFTSTSFSLNDGGLFLFWYAGSVAGFDTLEQETNFRGGIAVLAFEDGSTPSVSGDEALGDNGDGTWSLEYDPATPVPTELAPFSTQEGYLWSEPDWLRYRPDWWQQ